MRYEIICPACRSVDDGSPAALLCAVADALNLCQDGGFPVKTWHGILRSTDGYVLPLGDGRWTARTVTFDRFAQVPLPVPDDGFDD